MKYCYMKYFDKIKSLHKFMLPLLPSVQGDALIYGKDFENSNFEVKLGFNLLLKIFICEFYFYLLLSLYLK